MSQYSMYVAHGQYTLIYEGGAECPKCRYTTQLKESGSQLKNNGPVEYWQYECGKLTAEVARLRALLKEWFDDDYDGAELLIRTGKALKGDGE